VFRRGGAEEGGVFSDVRTRIKGGVRVGQEECVCWGRGGEYKSGGRQGEGGRVSAEGLSGPYNIGLADPLAASLE
jgi:hypothetical protein